MVCQPMSQPPPDETRRLTGLVWHRIALARRAHGATVLVGRALGRLGVRADAITGASMILALGAAVALGSGWVLEGAALFMASGLCDILDGIVARSTRTSSRFGALLDSTADRISDAAPLVGIAVWLQGQSMLFVVPVLALVASALPSYVRARSEALSSPLPPLFMRRAERSALLIASLLAAWAVPPEHRELVLVAGIGLLGALSILGTFAALRAARAGMVDVRPKESALRGMP
jgi:CDP-diacylglycerol---glycerol-3-phosphate 3-phosphatidyltransferase